MEVVTTGCIIMTPELFRRVRLLTDRFHDEGADRNAIGYIIEIYDDANCEVEFSSPDGTTYAQIVATPAELEDAEEQAGG